MHIPDGYLSPQTAGVFYAAMVPVWGVAMNKVKKTLDRKQVPLLALGAAFSFTIMMFNLPVPGGSSVHAVGAVLLGILLGPWAASIGISVALLIQALIFGDGGLLTLGANCFNMAFVMPFVGYGIYRLLAGHHSESEVRVMVAAVIAGYIGICVAALCAAVEFGSQYSLFQANGHPLYFMYPMKVAVVAMMTEHLTLAGPAEGVFTALGLWFIRRTYPELLTSPTAISPMKGVGAGV